MSSMTDNAPAMFLKVDKIEGDKKIDGFEEAFQILGFEWTDGAKYRDSTGVQLNITIQSRKGQLGMMSAKKNSVVFEGKITNTEMSDKDRKKVMVFKFEKGRCLEIGNAQVPGQPAVPQLCQLFCQKIEAKWDTYDDDGDIVESIPLDLDFIKGKSQLS